MNRLLIIVCLSVLFACQEDDGLTLCDMSFSATNEGFIADAAVPFPYIEKNDFEGVYDFRTSQCLIPVQYQSETAWYQQLYDAFIAQVITADDTVVLDVVYRQKNTIEYYGPYISRWRFSDYNEVEFQILLVKDDIRKLYFSRTILLED